MIIPTLIILAGGRSSRMGSPKGLLQHPSGKTLIEAHLCNFSSAGGTKAIIVLGHQVTPYTEKFSWMKINEEHQYKNLNVKAVHNEQADLGQFSSLQKGLKELSTNENCYITPIDAWPITTSTWKSLLAHHGNQQVIIPTFNDKGGHPVFLRADFISTLHSLDLASVDARLDHQIKKLQPSHILRIALNDSSTTTNINSKEDLMKMNAPKQ